MVGCAEQQDQIEGENSAAILGENGFNFNGFAFNGFNFNGFSFNGFNYNGFNFNGMTFNGMNFNGMTFNGMNFNGFTFNGLETSAGLSSTSGLMTTEGGREFLTYLVKIAYPAGHSLTKQDQYGNSYTFQGSLGVAPEIETGTCDLNCQEKVSGALLAHVNNSGLHVGIWLDGPDNGIGWGSSPQFPFQEATYFGNLFAPNMPGYYCAGRDLAAGDAKGRLGSPFGNNGNVLMSPYGTQYDATTGGQVPVFCASGGNNYCTAQNEGYSSCSDLSPVSPYSAGHRWTHPVTVYRNFEPTQVYKICNKVSGKCLGVVNGSTADGASVEQRTYAGLPGQTWQVLQLSGNNYKFINKTSGMAMDVSGTQVVQHPYNGGASQIMPLTYLASNQGFVNLMTSSTQANMFMAAGASNNDGALIQNISGYATGSGSPDFARWTFTATGPATIDPGANYRLVPKNAPDKSIDIANGSTTNGTPVQIYSSWNGDGQKVVLRDAGKGNVKLTMKANPNKCLGPKGGALTPGTHLEVQDCNGGNAQAFITGETAAGSGTFMLKNVGAPGMCVDVLGASTANGAAMDIYPCNGNNNQLFGAQLAP